MGRAWWGWAFVGTVVLAAAAMWMVHIRVSGEVAGFFRDEAIYVSTAKALAEGVGYRQPSLPGMPPEMRYPPLLPALLAVVWRVSPNFPANLPAQKTVSALAGIGLVFAAAGYLRRVGFPAPVAFAAAALTAASPMVFRYATSVASELPFAFFSVVALWAIELAAQPAAGMGAVVVAGVCAALAMLTRIVGFTVIGAGVICLAWRSGWRRGFLFGAAAGAFLLPWFVWLLAQRDAAAHADHSYFAIVVEDGGLPGLGALLQNALELPFVLLGVALPGAAQLGPGAMPPWIVTVVFVCGVATLVRASMARFGIYWLLSMLVFILVPWGVQPRFFVPLVPLTLATFLQLVLGSAGNPGRRVVGVLLVAGLLVAGAVGHAQMWAGARASGLPALQDISPTARWSDYQQAIDWVRNNTSPEEIVGTLYDPLIYLYTGRQAVRAYPSLWQPQTAQVDEWVARYRLRYLVELPSPEGRAKETWKQWLADHRADLMLRFGGSSEVRVWEIVKP